MTWKLNRADFTQKFYLKNSGIVQGRLIRKGKIPKYGYDNNVFIHWKDFNVGIDLAMAGIVFHITDCDLFTKEFLLSQGVELNDSECIPPDPYIQMRMSKTKTLTRTTPVVDDKLRRFLEFEGRVLKLVVSLSLHFTAIDVSLRCYTSCATF